MMNSRLLSLREGILPCGLIIIFIALCIGSLIPLGLAKISLGLVCLAGIFLYCKKVEYLFLFWLLTFSFFSTDATAFLTVGGHPIITYDRLFIAIMFFIFLKQIALRERKPLPIDKIEIVFILFIVITAFSVATKSLDKLMGARVLTDVFFLPLVVYVLSKNFISDSKYLRKFVGTLFVVGIYLSILAFYEHFTREDIFPTEAGLAQESFGWVRPSGPYPAASTFAVCAAICFFIALYKYITLYSKDIHTKLSHIIVLIMTLLATFLTLFRGIWLAWALGLLSWLLTRRKQLIKLSFLVVGLLILIIPLVDKVNRSDFISEFYELRIANVSNIQDRFERYGYALSFFRENPIYGIGFQNYRLLMRTTGQHNQMLAVLSETGIIGVSAYGLLFLLLLYSGIKSYKSTSNYAQKQFSLIYLSIIVVYLVVGLGLTTGFDKHINLLFFAISGAALGPKRDNLLE